MEKTIVMTDVEARILHKVATPEWKSVLENNFGKAFFSTKITDRIKSYEDACSEIGEKPMDEKALKQLGFTDDEINYRKLKTIGKALNEGWVPDWTNTSESKWQPYFRLSSGAFVFYGTDYYCSSAYAGYGSRLCFKSDELATYAGKQFTDIYKGFMF